MKIILGKEKYVPHFVVVGHSISRHILEEIYYCGGDEGWAINTMQEKHDPLNDWYVRTEVWVGRKKVDTIKSSIK